MNKSLIIRGTLAWCNEKRALKQLPALVDLPIGSRGDPGSCPCGIATGLWVDYVAFAGTEDAWRRGAREILPAAVQDFVDAFDNGRFPEYDSQPPPYPSR